MQLTTVAAALATAGLVAGCGFTPKKPPSPTDGPRVPINHSAPNPRPWSAPPPIVSSSTPPAVELQDVSQTTSRSAKIEPPSLESGVKQVSTTAEPMKPPRTDPLSLILNSPRLAFETTLFVWPEPEIDQVPDAIAQAAAAVPTANSDAAPLAEATPAQPQPVDVPSAPNPTLIPPETNRAKEPDNAPESVTATPSIDVDPAKLPTMEKSTESSPTDANSINPEAPTDNAITQPPPAPASQTNHEPKLVTWSAQKGTRLSDMLAEWGAQENWTVRWNTQRDFRIDADFSIDAPDFLSAAGQILKAYREAGQGFQAAAYSNHVLVITTTE